MNSNRGTNVKPMLSSKSAKDIAVAYAERIWDQQDLSAIDELIHSDCVIHSLLGNFKGPESMKTIVRAWLKGFPDLTVKNISIIGEEDLVATQWNAQGTHTGEFKGIEPTNKRVTYSGASIYRVKEAKIIEYRAYLDMQHLLKQIS